jgi:hypothetical protein
MDTRLLFPLLAAGMLAGHPPGIADQNGRLVGVHGLPQFILDRVELPAGATDARSAHRGASCRAGPDCAG